MWWEREGLGIAEPLGFLGSGVALDHCPFDNETQSVIPIEYQRILLSVSGYFHVD